MSAGSWRKPGERIAEEVDLPQGYFVSFAGQFEHMERARLRLMIVVPLALLLVFFLLYTSMNSVRDALIIFTGAPFAALMRKGNRLLIMPVAEAEWEFVLTIE